MKPGHPPALLPFDDAFLRELMGWFPDLESARAWGGPDLRFPFTEATFREDAKLAGIPPRVLVQPNGRLAAFGQYYLRAGRCHLGRLAVAPDARGGGLGTRLVRELCAEGRAVLGVGSCSLFVVPSNVRARALYERLGFAPAEYPEPAPEVAPYVYMVTGTDGPRFG